MKTSIAQKPSRLPTGARVILLCLVISISLSAVIYFYFPEKLSRVQQENREYFDHTLANVMSGLATKALIQSDTSFLSDMFNSLRPDSDLAFAIVIDSDDHPFFLHDRSAMISRLLPLAAGHGNSDFHRLGNTDLHLIESSLFHDDDRIGRLMIGVYTDRTNRQSISTSQTVLIMAAIILLVGLTTISIFGRRLVRPLSEMTRAAEMVATGDFEIGDINFNSREFKPLAKAFRQMVTQIKIQMNELSQSEFRYRSVVDNAHEGILVLCEGRIVYHNAKVSRIAGYEKDDIFNDRALQHVYPDDRFRCIRALYRLEKKSGSTVSWECRIIDKCGEVHWVRATGICTGWNQQPAALVFISDFSDEKADEEALSFTRFSIDRITDCAYWVDSSGRFVHMNQTARELSSQPGKDQGDFRIYDMDSSLDRKTWPEFWHKAVKNRHLTYEARFANKEGGHFPVEVSVNYQSFKGQEYCCFLVRDIADRKDWERQLKQLAEYPKGNPNMVFSMDRSGSLLYRNPAVTKTLKDLGLAIDEIWRILPDNFSDCVDRCIASGRDSETLESRFEHRAWLWTLTPVAQEQVVHVHATDISDRLESEAQKAKLSAAVEQSHNTVVITNSSGLIEYANPMFVKITGMSLEEVTGLEVSIVKSGIDGPAEYAAIWEALDELTFWTGNLKNRKINGDYYWAKEVVSPILDGQLEIIGYLFVGQDVTKEIDLQQKVIESDKLSAVGMLAAGVAHEFKNYLGGIIGNASFALEDIDSEDGLALARDTLEQVISLGERANDVAMSLLTYSRAKPEEVNRENLKSIIDKSISLVEKEMSNLNIELVFYHEEVPDIAVSASKIQQLLLNLLINAQHAIKSHGVITVALLREGNSAKIKIGDSGSGIPQEILSRVFDPFFSTKGVWGRDEVIGTGMGLAICRNLAREHGGDLEAKSIVGMGTTFALTLPLDEEHRTLEGQLDRHEEVRAILFTLDKDEVTQYFKEGVPLHVTILPVDNFAKMPSQLSDACDLVICDARFSAKVELFKTGDHCKRNEIPYVMVNCGAMEYQLSELYDDAAACFKENASLTRILEILRKEVDHKP